MKKSFSWLFLIVAILSLLIVLVDPTFDVSFTENEVQKMVNQKLPFAGTVGDNNYTIAKGANIDFTQSNRIKMNGRVLGQRNGSTMTGEFDIEGRLVYKPSLGEFYFSDVQVNKIDVVDITLSQEHQSTLDSTRKIGAKVLDKLSKTVPGAELLIGSQKKDLMKIAENEFKKQALSQLSSIPVFTLDNTNSAHRFAQLTLVDIKVSHQKVTFSLGIQRIIGNFWLFVIFILSLLVFLFIQLRIRIVQQENI